MSKSYYEQILEKNGGKLTLMQKYARQAEFGRVYISKVAKRKKKVKKVSDEG